MFFCTVEESKPIPHFQWIIIYKNGTECNLGNGTLLNPPNPAFNGTFLKIVNNLELVLMKHHHKIICKATIESLPWKNSEIILNVKCEYFYIFHQEDFEFLLITFFLPCLNFFYS